jgi:hypothetical protein
VAGERVRALALAAVLALALALGADLALAHPADFPHEEPRGESSEADSTSPLLIVAGLVVTLLLVAGLVWLKERARRAEAAEVERGTSAEPGPGAGQGLSTKRG